MTEQERARAIEAIQLELFCRKRELERQAEQIELDFRARLELVKSQGTKVCRKCGREKSVKQFYREDRFKDGYNPWCRLCKQQRYQERKNAA